MTTRTIEWAARVAADATDRRARQAGRDRWDATDTAFFLDLFGELAFMYFHERTVGGHLPVEVG